MHVKGQLLRAQFENLASDPSTSADKPDGRAWLDTVNHKAKFYDGTAVRTLVDTDSTQTLTGKTIDGDDNTVQDLPVTSIKTVLADANKALVRNASGVPTSALILNANVDTAAAIARSKLASGSNNHVIINDGSGVLSSEASLAISRGGTGAATKAAGFDALSPMTTSGDVIYGGVSGTGTRLAKGSDGQVLTLASGIPSWANASITNAVAAKTGAYTATTADYFIACSGAAFTVGLYTAVGNSGRIIRIKKTDSTIANIITVDGNSTETIDGSLTQSLYIQNEMLTLISDGANWQVLERYTPMNWWAFTPTFTSNVWASATTPTSIAFYGQKVGSTLNFRGSFASGTAQSNTADMILPNSWTAESTYRTLSVVGALYSTGNSSNNGYTILCTPSSSTLNFGLDGDAANDLTAATATNFGSSSTMYLQGSIALSNWAF